jgi:hypothetical protein
MSISLYDASIPVFIRALKVLDTLLEKAAASGIDPAGLVEARLAPDMYTLAGQVQRASDTAKASAARLSGAAAPAFADEETTLADLKARVAKTVDFLEGIPPETLDGRVVTMKLGGAERSFSSEDYLLRFGLPNFFFHITTAYDLLRHKGVTIGKRDFLGPF